MDVAVVVEIPLPLPPPNVNGEAPEEGLLTLVEDAPAELTAGAINVNVVETLVTPGPNPPPVDGLVFSPNVKGLLVLVLFEPAPKLNPKALLSASF